MIRTAIKTVFAHKLRLALTAVAIVMGVAFVAGTYIFTDTINNRFDAVFTDIYDGIDVEVGPEEADFGNEIPSIDAGIIDVVTAVDGVAAAEGGVGGIAKMSFEGEALGGQGPPTLGFSWGLIGEMNPLKITTNNGRPPEAAGEVSIDIATAERYGIELGDVVTVATAVEPEDFEVVGLANFGEEDSFAGATIAVFELDEAQRLFDLEGEFSSISVQAADGVDTETLTERINAVLPAGAVAITSQVAADNQLTDVSEGLGFLNTIFLVFAGIAIFVGSFIIYNTFRIIVAQRSKELAMMRAVGATGGQIIRLVLIEALVVAIVASAIGIGVGVLLAMGISAAMNALASGTIPQGSLTILPRTVIVASVVGLVVTMLSALLPARKAARVPPVAAMRDVEASTPASLHSRAIAGTLITGLGAVSLFTGLFADFDNAIWFVALGALVMFLGVATLAPLAARPLATVLGWPLSRLYGVTGILSQENTKRQPRRTASSASALMIGVALVVLVAIFAATVKSSVEEQITESFPADLSFTSNDFNTGVDHAFIETLRANDDVADATGILFGEIRLDGDEIVPVIGLDPTRVSGVFLLDASPGALEALGDSHIMILQEELEDRGWMVGDTIGAEFALTGDQTLEIVGTFTANDFGPFLISEEAYLDNFSNTYSLIAFASAADGTTLDTARATVEAIAANYPDIIVQNKSEYIADVEAQIDSALVLFQGLLGFAVIIAVIGITNTLALTIFERTHEIGLLRAVGMARRQVRRMIRWEAVIIALFGAVLGVGLGIFFGWSIVQALAEDGLSTFTIPFGQLVVYIVLAGFAGILAAIWPARKAAKLNILEAIAYE